MQQKRLLAQRRQAVGAEFMCGQHDAVDFLERFLDTARQEELDRSRYGLWGGLAQTSAAATQVDRLFSYVQETRRQCMSCRGTVRSWYSKESILRVSPELVDGGPMTMSELYFASCKSHESSVMCPHCQCDASHRTQMRMMTAPTLISFSRRLLALILSKGVFFRWARNRSNNV